MLWDNFSIWMHSKKRKKKKSVEEMGVFLPFLCIILLARNGSKTTWHTSIPYQFQVKQAPLGALQGERQAVLISCSHFASLVSLEMNEPFLLPSQCQLTFPLTSLESCLASFSAWIINWKAPLFSCFKVQRIWLGSANGIACHLWNLLNHCILTFWLNQIILAILIGQ